MSANISFYSRQQGLEISCCRDSLRKASKCEPTWSRRSFTVTNQHAASSDSGSSGHEQIYIPAFIPAICSHPSTSKLPSIDCLGLLPAPRQSRSTSGPTRNACKSTIITSTSFSSRSGPAYQKSYVYYHLYYRDVGARCLSASPNDPYLGRINTRRIAPPQTLDTLLSNIRNAENISKSWDANIYASPDSDVPLDGGLRLGRLPGSPGSSPNSPLCVVIDDVHVKSRRSRQRLCCIKEATLSSHDISHLNVSSDGRHLLCVYNETQVAVRNLETLAPACGPFRNESGAILTAVMHNSKVIAMTEDLGRRIWDINNSDVCDSRALVSDRGRESTVGIALSPDGSKVVAFQRDSVAIQDLRSGEATLAKSTNRPVAWTLVSFSDDSKRFASADDHGTIIIWEVDGCRPVHAATLTPTNTIVRVALSPNAQYIATVHEDRTILLVDMKTGLSKSILDLHKAGDDATCLAFSYDSSLLAVGSRTGRILMIDMRSKAVIQTVEAHKQRITAMTFAKTKNQLFSASSDRKMRVWVIGH